MQKPSLYSIRTIIAMLLVGTLLACSQHDDDKKITVIVNADVLTMDESKPQAQAVVIENDLIVYVGDNDGAEKWRSKAQRFIDAQGNSVLPGLIDSHIHPVTSAVQMDDCSLDDEKLNVAQMRETILTCLNSAAKSDLIFPVINLNPADFAAQREDLDAISLRAFALFGSDGHTAWANSAALKMAGIGRDSVDPQNGRITRDKNGEPSGHLVDDAVGLLSKFLPIDDIETKVRMTEQVIGDLHAVGITSMMEASATEAELKVYQRLNQAGKLTVHTSVALFSEADDSATNLARLNDLRQRYDSASQLRVNTVKIFADGVPEYPTQSAALLTPYLNADGSVSAYSGKLYVEPATLNRFVNSLSEQQFNVHFHAIGDKAVRVGLDAFAAAQVAHKKNNNRFSISHLQIIDPADVSRFAANDVFASLQLFWAKPENYSVEAVQPYLGPQRSAMMYPARRLAQAGAVVVGGSDWNVSSFNPFEAMAAAICRCNEEEPSRAPLFPEQALNAEQMFKAYTINAAKMLGRDLETGSLQIGKKADLVVVDRALKQADADTIRKTGVRYTFAGGQLVYDSAKP